MRKGHSDVAIKINVFYNKESLDYIGGYAYAMDSQLDQTERQDG